MQPPANPHNEINKSAATLLAAATQAAMLLVQQRRKTLQDAGKHSQQTAHRIQKLQDQQLQAAKPIFKQAHQPGFWNQDLDSIADTYQTCKTWEPLDETAAKGVQTIEKGMDERHPGWRDYISETPTLHAPLTSRERNQEWAQQQIAAGYDPQQVTAQQISRQAHPHTPVKAVSPAVIAALAMTAASASTTTKDTSHQATPLTQ